MGKNFLFVLPIIFVLSFCVQAHLDAGQDISKSGYIIDFGYTPSEISEGTSVNFALNLVNGTTEKPVEMDSVFTRISLGEKTVFAGEIFPKNGSTSFSYTFQKSGSYNLYFEFRNARQVLEQHSFVVDAKSSSRNKIYIYVIFSLVALMVFIGLKKKRK